MGSILDTLRVLRDAGAVKRWHVKRTLRGQTVAEHSFGVLQIAMACMPACMNAEAVFDAIMRHDYAELATGDVPAPTKRKFPDLAEALLRAESYNPVLAPSVMLTPVEANFVKWCDTTELVLWCMEELRLGNQNMYSTACRGLGYMRVLSQLGDIPPKAKTLANQLIEHCGRRGVRPVQGSELDENT